MIQETSNSYFFPAKKLSFIETNAIANIIKKAPMLEKTVTGSCSTKMEAIAAATTSDKNKTVEIDSEGYLSPLSLGFVRKKPGATGYLLSLFRRSF